MRVPTANRHRHPQAPFVILSEAKDLGFCTPKIGLFPFTTGSFSPIFENNPYFGHSTADSGIPEIFSKGFPTTRSVYSFARFTLINTCSTTLFTRP